MRKKEYISPRLIMVAFKVEQGFDGSQTKALGLNTGKGDRDIEERTTTTTNWGGDNNSWF